MTEPDRPEPDRPDPDAPRDGDEVAGGAAERPRGSAETVEAAVRAQLAKALGGRRGMVEAALPTLIFTIFWVTTRELRLALTFSIAAAVLMLLVRIVQRSSVQFCVNALLGIGIGWFFVSRSAAAGGSAEDQALAYFLPGILYNAVYAVALSLSCLARWPLMGFVVGSVTGELTAWRQDRQVTRLCTLLTWVLVVPCALRVAVQAPIWLAARAGSFDADAAIAILGVAKVALGWPLQLAALGTMIWLLARNRTPVDADREPPASPA